ncbi:tyrosine-type recombinase/integrase [Xanthomonas theicola]|nr:tyrosine-type recombinase/integrase [Xanthomonas theicola]
MHARACRSLQIEDLHFHDLRHEGASRLFEQGYDIPEVAIVTGHRDWKSLKRYTNLAPESLYREPKAGRPGLDLDLDQARERAMGQTGQVIAAACSLAVLLPAGHFVVGTHLWVATAAHPFPTASRFRRCAGSGYPRPGLGRHRAGRRARYGRHAGVGAGFLGRRGRGRHLHLIRRRRRISRRPGAGDNGVPLAAAPR